MPEVADLSAPITIEALADRLRDAASPIDLLILNAGMVSGAKPRRDAQGIELTFSSTIVAHHRLTVRLLNDQSLAPNARIIIVGSEVARGDVPMTSVIDVEAFATKATGGNLVEAIKRIAKAEGPGKFRANDAYATAKACVAWWTAALAQRLPAGMTVNAISPGLTPSTNNGRNMPWIARVIIPRMMKLLGMSGEFCRKLIRW
ncbi:short chain dehydrogenase [Ruegeria denitrificans]|uniref:Short chain dehydrogenase n=1 Tax=Ruegeria denitrificans TaxID=1715692 RepID=A0A0P1IJU5_9RHOB|nr:short chain dehydrogenase [Ruegeria denitrificans]